jgi:hypothetical protein
MSMGLRLGSGEDFVENGMITVGVVSDRKRPCLDTEGQGTTQASG